MENNNEYISGVISKLKTKLQITSDRQLAGKLELSPSSLSATLKRGLLPYEKIINFCKKTNISLDEIFLNIEENNINNKINISEDKLQCNKDFSSIKLLDNEDYSISIPTSNLSKEEYRAYINDKKIYIIDTRSKEISHNTYCLIKSNNIYFPVVISIDLDGSYSLRDDEDNTTKLAPDEFKKFEIIGKISFRLIRETFI
ncbi:helix-turn-helix domain-containing protein [Aliarcobacter cryaerophilus]|uniref:helix-turn-helix domain-containing protein n=1 Tax=Aliarcobacter cryaerophilus TaxID=28198 RepID=UPI003DA4DC3C